MKPSMEEDRRLLDRCFAGDRNAAERLVVQFSGLVYRAVQQTLITKHLTFDSQLLEDLHNTVFLNLFENNCKKLKQYQGKNGCSLATWIRLIAVRVVLNYLRKKGFDALNPRKYRISIEDIPELKSSEQTASAMLEKAEMERLLEEGIQSLPARSRLLMKLHLNHKLPVEKIAETMKISVQNVYTMKHRAIQKLKDYVAIKSNKK